MLKVVYPHFQDNKDVLNFFKVVLCVCKCINLTGLVSTSADMRIEGWRDSSASNAMRSACLVACIKNHIKVEGESPRQKLSSEPLHMRSDTWSLPYTPCTHKQQC